MCGIYGVVGKKAVEKTRYGLQQLQYRGYDSCGVACIYNDEIIVDKCLGTQSELIIDIDADICIGHTRWATHGKVSVSNAHPIISNDGNYAIVHNGIIENYKELKKDIEETLSSQTDTEVLLYTILNAEGETILEKIVNSYNNIKGKYAYVIMDRENSALYAVKYGCPLYVSNDKCEYMVSSDCNSMNRHIYALEDGEIAVISDDIIYYNASGKIIEKEYQILQKEYSDIDKGKYPHYMIKEINDTPQSILNSSIELDIPKLCQITSIITNNIDKIYIIGCGTAYNAGLIGCRLLRKTGLDVECYLASEYKYDNDIKINSRTAVIYISQSGETADTIGCLEKSRQYSTKNICITNVVDSTLSRKCDITINMRAGREIAVASTKAYSSQVYILYEIANFLSTQQKTEVIDILSAVNLTLLNNENIINISNIVSNYEKVFFIGRMNDYNIAKESSLKLKEITYINSQAMQSGELKHGTLSLIDERSIVILIDTIPSLANKNDSTIEEIKSRGGRVVIVSSYREACDISIPRIDSELITISAIIPMQLLSYYTAINKGNNPDMPRNLAKSVTVE